MSRSRLGAYLNRLERPLASLPEDLRREWREEARQHLAALIEAGSANGLATEAAEDAAFHEFGDPDRIGRDVYLQLRRQAAWRYTPGFAWAIAALVLCVVGSVEIGAFFWFAPLELIVQWMPAAWYDFGAHLLSNDLWPLCTVNWVYFAAAGLILAGRFRRRVPPAWLSLSVLAFAGLAGIVFHTWGYPVVASAGLLVLVIVMQVATGTRTLVEALARRWAGRRVTT